MGSSQESHQPTSPQGPEKEKKNCIGSETGTYINLGKGDILPRVAASLLHRGSGGTCEDLEDDKPFPVSDQDLKLIISRARLVVVSLCAKSTK